jgi:hypothetical protein
MEDVFAGNPEAHSGDFFEGVKPLPHQSGHVNDNRPPRGVFNRQVNDRFSLFSSDQKVTGNWSLFLHLGACWRTLHIGPYLSFFLSNPLKIRVLDGGGGGIACAALRPSQFGSRCSLDVIGR